MTTLDDVLQIQLEQNILFAPSIPPTPAEKHSQMRVAATKATTNIALKNTTSSPNLYVTITGLDINRNGAVWMMQSDGVSYYYPANPGQDQQPLQANVTIVLGGPGSTRTVTIPQLAGGRIYYCKDGPLTFKLNRGGNGPGLVEPSITNPSDANYNLYWSFCEFTFNSAQLFANISYVDFVCIPVAVQLESETGGSQVVQGIPADGLAKVCTQLQEQQQRDGAPWGNLVVKHPQTGAFLRALAPYQAIVMDRSLFSNYYTGYVDQVWAKYSGSDLRLNTQVQWGVVTGRVSGNTLNFNGVGAFTKPSAADIFSCSTGAFSHTADDELGNVGARLCAAFNRTTLLINSNQPDGENVNTYYTNNPTNHYSRIMHGVNLDHRGYAFPYDDVVPSGGSDQAGTVASGNPKLMTIFIGGGAPTSTVRVRDMARPGRQLVAGRRVLRRGLGAWGSTAEDEKAALADMEAQAESMSDSGVELDLDLEKGGRSSPSGKLAALSPASHSNTALVVPKTTAERTLSSLVPAAVASRAGALVERIEGSPAYARVKPAVDVAVRCAAAFLSLSLRAFISRATVVLFLVFFYLLTGPLGRMAASSRDEPHGEAPGLE